MTAFRDNIWRWKIKNPIQSFNNFLPCNDSPTYLRWWADASWVLHRDGAIRVVLSLTTSLYINLQVITLLTFLQNMWFFEKTCSIQVFGLVKQKRKWIAQPHSDSPVRVTTNELIKKNSKDGARKLQNKKLYGGDNNWRQLPQKKSLFHHDNVPVPSWIVASTKIRIVFSSTVYARLSKPS